MPFCKIRSGLPNFSNIPIKCMKVMNKWDGYKSTILANKIKSFDLPKSASSQIICKYSSHPKEIAKSFTSGFNGQYQICTKCWKLYSEEEVCDSIETSFIGIFHYKDVACKGIFTLHKGVVCITDNQSKEYYFSLSLFY